MSPSFESARFSTIPASLSPSPAIGEHFQHPGGPAANSLVRRCAARLEFLKEFGIEDPQGQTAVVPELPSIPAIDHVQNDLSQASALLRIEGQALHEADQILLDVARIR